MKFFISFIVCMLVMPFTVKAAIQENPAYYSHVYDKATVMSGDLDRYEIGSEVVREWGIRDADGADLVNPETDEDGDLPTAIVIFIVVMYLSLSKYGGGGPGGRRRTARQVYRSGGFPK
ncbi:MAG: hypothetical protein RR588_06195 [Solibacillus sp.]